MSMKSCRRIAGILAALTILCGGICKLFTRLPGFLNITLSILAILSAIATILIVYRFHRCPHCGKFIPITLRPEICLYCNTELN